MMRSSISRSWASLSCSIASSDCACATAWSADSRRRNSSSCAVSDSISDWSADFSVWRASAEDLSAAFSSAIDAFCSRSDANSVAIASFSAMSDSRSVAKAAESAELGTSRDGSECVDCECSSTFCEDSELSSFIDSIWLVPFWSSL